MKRVFVFAATIGAILVGGVAIAFVSANGGDELSEKETTTTLVVEEERPDEVTDHHEDGDLLPVGDWEEEEPTEAPKGKAPEPDTNPPDLAILYPENNSHFTETHLAFEGTVEPGSKVYAAGYEADVDEEGHWRIVLILSPGGNLATFTAVDAAGNESQAQVKVFLDEAEPDKDEEPKESEFVAYQKYGSCGEEVPYDIWYGSGTPGTGVWVASDFGSGHTEVDENGKWELKVYFETAPCNDEFAVVVETDDGYRKVFEFIRICEESDK
ncbi:MAG: hypothetical protein OEM32_01960 [Acidimicrobiia bacterium]|nr:hypothetical protein [Acidimicrobiia bacterium]